MEFEWHDEKRQRNLDKHGIDFRDAVRVFQDPQHLWGFDEEHYDVEERWWILGRVHDTVLVVVWTERDGDVIRIISARRATRHEEETYYESFAR